LWGLEIRTRYSGTVSPPIVPDRWHLAIPTGPEDVPGSDLLALRQSDFTVYTLGGVALATSVAHDEKGCRHGDICLARWALNSVR